MRIISMMAFLLAFSGGMLFYASGVFADNELAAKTEMRKLELETQRAKIHSDNIDEAIAATETGLKSGDAEIRSMTLEAALGSSDLRVQTTALRWIFSQKDRIIFHIIRPEAPDDGDEYTYELWRGLVLNEPELDLKTDEISIKRHSRFLGGSLIPGGFQLEFMEVISSAYSGYECSFKGQVDKEALTEHVMQLKGTIDCLYPAKDTHGAKGDKDGMVAFTVRLS